MMRNPQCLTPAKRAFATEAAALAQITQFQTMEKRPAYKARIARMTAYECGCGAWHVRTAGKP